MGDDKERCCENNALLESVLYTAWICDMTLRYSSVFLTSTTTSPVSSSIWCSVDRRVSASVMSDQTMLAMRTLGASTCSLRCLSTLCLPTPMACGYCGGHVQVLMIKNKRSFQNVHRDMHVAHGHENTHLSEDLPLDLICHHSRIHRPCMRAHKL